MLAKLGTLPSQTAIKHLYTKAAAAQVGVSYKMAGISVILVGTHSRTLCESDNNNNIHFDEMA